MTVQPRPTPNPDSLKFEIDGAEAIAAGLLAVHSAREAAGHALAEALFALDGVESLLVVPSFVTVTKHPAASWDLLAAKVGAVLRDHLGGQPA